MADVRVLLPVGMRFFSVMSRLAVGPTHTLLYNTFWQPFPSKGKGQNVKLTTLLHLVPRLRVMKLRLSFSVYLNDVVLD
jgi:hypothetical protein